MSLPTVHVNFALNHGGLGDQICKVPALQYILNNYPHVVPHIWAHDYVVPLLSHFFGEDLNKRIFVKPISLYSETRPEYNWPAYSTGSVDHSSLGIHLVDHAFRCLVDRDAPSDVERQYPVIRPEEIALSHDVFWELLDPYVVITTGFTQPVKEFPSTEINKVADYVISKGYKPVFLGKRQNAFNPKSSDRITATFNKGVDYSKGVDLVDKTTLLEAAAILARASAVVGVEGGLIHLAACSDVPIVAGYTFVDPKTRAPYRARGETKIIVPSTTSCRFCQTRMNFVYNHSFNNCFTKTLECVSQMTAAKFIAALETILLN